MAIGKKLLGLFVNEETETKPVVAEKVETPIVAPTLTPVKPLAPLTTPAQKFIDILNDAILSEFAGNNVCYLSFKKVCDSMASIITQEDMRLKSALASMTALGAKKEIIIQTGQSCLAILDKELSEFNGAIDQKVNIEIGAKQKEVQDLEKTLAEKKETITKLQKEIGDVYKVMEEKSNAIISEKAELESAKSSFLMAHTVKKSEIMQDLEKINQYL